MINPEQMCLIGLFIAHAPTLRSNLARARAFQCLLDPGITYELEERGERVLLWIDSGCSCGSIMNRECWRWLSRWR